MRVYDLRKIASACGDYTLYVIAELDKLRPGERLKLVAARTAQRLLDEVAESLQRSGIARILEKGFSDEAYYVVVERA